MALVTRPYDLNTDYEKAVAFLCATRPGFLGRLGYRLDAKALALPACQLVVSTAQAIAVDAGKGPQASALVMQRLRNQFKAGKLTHDDLMLVQAFFDEMERTGKGAAIDEEAVSGELVPILKKRVLDNVALSLFEAKGKGQVDPSAVLKDLEEAQTIGVHDRSVGLETGEAMWEAIERRRLIARRPTGISQLDAQLSGGAVPGALSFVIGGPGDGKSMYLSHIAANCMRKGGLVGCVTLEVDEVEWHSRVVANLMDTPIDVVQGPDNGAIRRAFREAQEAGRFGALVVKDMTGRPTKVQDLKDWNAYSEDKFGRPFDLVVVDYADKMEPHKTCKGMYEGMLYVYEGLRMWAAERRLWPLWTASQSKAKGKDQKLLGLYDAADSTHKVRVADLVITLNVDKDKGEIRYWIAKHRLGKSDILVGPLPIDFSRGRMAPISAFLGDEKITPL